VTIQDLGSLGELIAAVATVATLVYLAAQIRQNTRALRSSSFHGVTDSFNQINMRIANDESLARIFRLGSEDLAQLTDDERVRFGFMFLSAFRVFETLYYQDIQRIGESQLWEAEKTTMVALLSGPGARVWWDSNPLSFTPSFREFVGLEILPRIPEGSRA
jgi:hypothetical protein